MSTPPNWLDDLVEAVVSCIEAHSAMGNCGFRYCPPETDADYWLVLLYPMPVQLRGGDEDGALVDPGFSLDLDALHDLLDHVVAFRWTAHPYSAHDRDHPSVAIEGLYQGHGVYLEIQAYAPDDEPPGMTLDVGASDKRGLH